MALAGANGGRDIRKGPMHFLWPHMLWLLLAVPVLVGAYVLALRRRAKGALRFATLSTLKDAMGPRQRFRRHVPPLIFLVAMVAAIFAMARPSAVITLPSDQRTIVLAMDVSLSMRAADILPTRMHASQAAAKAFVQQQPPDVRVAVVSFAGTASVVQPPTHNREDLVAAIDRLDLQRHTAIGSGILVSLATLFPEEREELEAMLMGSGGPSRDAHRGGAALGRAGKADKADKKAAAPVAPGSYASAAIILLTDGRRTMGPDSLDAARVAADHGVRVYTVGFGTAEGAAANVDGYSIYMRFDEETLRAIADITRADYFHAQSASDLKQVYERLNAKFVLEKKETEISALASAAAVVLMIAAAALSLSWFSRIV
jgi:Ca-activated chloride channel family protein